MSSGGILNLVSVGNNNVFLTGNPSKTFYKTVYAKHTNFGLQKFRLDYDGLRDIRLTEPSTFTFTIKRYADLLMDTYLVLTLPDIYSPIFQPFQYVNAQGNTVISEWSAYEFKWIKDIGNQIVKELVLQSGTQVLHRSSGAYMSAMMNRDFTAEKKDLVNRMTGNIPELNDPANAYGRANCYPSAFYTPGASAEPSIRGRTIYIPINLSFTLNSFCAFPLCCLQSGELLTLTVTLRPIQELFQVRDVFDVTNDYPYIQPDFNSSQFAMYRFLQTPPSAIIDPVNYTNTVQTWNTDVHLIATYCFLSEDERRDMVADTQVYLIRDVTEYLFENVTGTSRQKLTNTNGMVMNWMFYLQRDDAFMRNEWSNYTNRPYAGLPSDIVISNSVLDTSYFPTGIPSQYSFLQIPTTTSYYGPLINPSDQSNTGNFITGAFAQENRAEILETAGILCDGIYRENTMTRGIYDYIEKYTRTRGGATDGLYCYNFCLNTDPFTYQPSGALNTSKFKNVELEISTFIPTINRDNASFSVICNIDGVPIGTTKPSWSIYDYNYNMVVFEERYNIVSFMNGQVGLTWVR